MDASQVKHTLNVIECLETKPGADGQLQTTRFKWVTSFHVTKNKAIELSNGARLRW